MTQTGNANEITFRPVARGIRRNAETGIEIRKVARTEWSNAGYAIFAPVLTGGFDEVGFESSAMGALESAIERVEMLREIIAEARTEASA